MRENEFNARKRERRLRSTGWEAHRERLRSERDRGDESEQKALAALQGDPDKDDAVEAAGGRNQHQAQCPRRFPTPHPCRANPQNQPPPRQ